MNKIFLLQRVKPFLSLVLTLAIGIFLGWIVGKSTGWVTLMNAAFLCVVAYFSGNAGTQFNTRTARLIQTNREAGRYVDVMQAVHRVQLNNLAKIVVHLIMVMALLFWGVRWLIFSTSFALFFIAGAMLFVVVILDILEWSGYLTLNGLSKRPLTPNNFEILTMFITAVMFAGAVVGAYLYT